MYAEPRGPQWKPAFSGPKREWSGWLVELVRISLQLRVLQLIPINSEIALRENEQLSLDLLLPVEPQLMWSYWDSFVLAQVQGTGIDIPKLEFPKGQFQALPK